MEDKITMSLTALFVCITNGIETEDQIHEMVCDCLELITGNREIKDFVHIQSIWIDEMGNPCGMMIVIGYTTYDIDFDTGRVRKVA